MMEIKGFVKKIKENMKYKSLVKVIEDIPKDSKIVIEKTTDNIKDDDIFCVLDYTDNIDIFIDSCIELNRIDLIVQLLSIEQLIKKFGVEILDILNFDLDSPLSTNEDLLDYALKNNRFDLVFYFRSSAFNDEIIAAYGLQIIDKYIQRLGYGGTDKWIFSSSKFLRVVLKNNKLQWLSYFNSPAFSIDILEEYGAQIIKKAPYTVDYLASSRDFLNIILKQEKYSLFDFFDSNIIDKEIIDKYTDELAMEFYSIIPCNMKSNIYYLIKMLSKERYDLVEYFADNLFIELIIKEYGVKILTHYNSRVPDNLIENEYYLDVVLSQGCYDLLPYFKKRAFSDYIINKYGKMIIDKIEKMWDGKVPNSLVSNDILRNYCIKENKCNLAIQFMFNKEIFNDKIITSNIAKALNLSYEELEDKLKYLLKCNEDLFDTFKIEMLDKRLECIDIRIIERLSTHEKLQKSIINLDEEKTKLIGKIFLLLDNPKYDLTEIILDILSYINNANIKIDNINDITDEQLRNFIYVISESRRTNQYNISSIDELTDEIFEEKINSYFNLIEKLIKKDCISVSSLKEALLEKKYGLTITRAEFIVSRYCNHLELLEKSSLSKEIFNIIKGIHDIYLSESKDELKFLYITSARVKTDFYSTIALESSIRKAYAKLYNDTLYKPKNEHILNESNPLYTENREIYDKIINSNFKGKKPKFYVLDGDFKMIVHVLGAYMTYNEPENYKEDWDRAKIESHGICCSYVSNDLMLYALYKHPMYGFASFEESALLSAGSYDLYSDSAISNYSISMSCIGKFYPPELMIAFTRDKHNEFILERRHNINNKTFKRNPDYVVYFVDDINKTDNFSCSLFFETIIAAVQNDIPIIIVDKLKYIKREYEKHINLKNKFYKNKDSISLEKLVIHFLNNCASCRTTNDSKTAEYRSYFSSAVNIDFFLELLKFIRKVPSPQCITLLETLDNILDRESHDILAVQSKISKLLIELADDKLIGNKTNIIDEIDQKRIIVNYYYNSSEDVQEKISYDIENNIPYNKIIEKINNNTYTNVKHL